MSAGRFVRSKYAADYGAGTAIHPIRVQEETLLLTISSEENTPPAGDVTNPISAQISRGRRARGLSPRFITLQLLSTATPPATYAAGSIVRLPALNRVIFEAAVPGSSAAYLGTDWQVISATPERAV